MTFRFVFPGEAGARPHGPTRRPATFIHGRRSDGQGQQARDMARERPPDG